MPKRSSLFEVYWGSLLKANGWLLLPCHHCRKYIYLYWELGQTSNMMMTPVA